MYATAADDFADFTDYDLADYDFAGGEADDAADDADHGVTGTCAYCGADFILDGAIEIFVDARGERRLEWRGCCASAQSIVERFGVEELLGASWEEVAAGLAGGQIQRVEAGQAVVRGREVELADSDGLIVERLETEIVTGGAAQAELFQRIDDEHRHHHAPRGWHFGVVARRGALVVGVVTCGRPVSRHLQAQGCVEVTRCCVFGDERLKRDVASALYRAAFREYVRRGCTWTTQRGQTSTFTKLITYTLPSESGASLRAAGFTDEGAAGGGSWDRAARARGDHAPTDVKVRWSLAFPAPKAPRGPAGSAARNVRSAAA